MSDDDIQQVECPACGHEQPDFGPNVRCEVCKAAPMPYHNEAGELVDE